METVILAACFGFVLLIIVGGVVALAETVHDHTVTVDDHEIEY